MDEWKKQIGSRPYLVGVFIIVVLLLCGWLYTDSKRNEPIYHDTDSTVADLEKRIDRIESGLNRLQDRITESEKAVTGIADAVGRSREQAEIITESVGRTEDRIDEAIQRSGRIQNIIEEVERINR